MGGTRLLRMLSVVAASALMVGFAQAAPTLTPLKKSPPVEVKDTKDYFRWFFATKSKFSGRGEFETEEQYKKRLPPALDSQKVVYFVVENDPKVDKGYSYDIDNRKLVASAGWLVDSSDRKDLGMSPGEPIIIKTVYWNQGSYPATNAFGATFTVTQGGCTNCILNMTNMAKCPEGVFDRSTGHFTVALVAEPKRAERLSRNMEMIVGVTLMGYEKSTEGFVTVTKPTFHDPRDLGRLDSVIDCRLREVILREKTSKQVLAEYAMATE